MWPEHLAGEHFFDCVDIQRQGLIGKALDLFIPGYKWVLTDRIRAEIGREVDWAE